MTTAPENQTLEVSAAVLSPVTQPITLSELKSKLPPFIDVPIDGLGTFRCHRLSVIDVMEYQSQLGEIASEDGTADRAQYIAHAVTFVAKSLRGEYATDDGREVLRTMPFDVLTKLITSSMEASRANIAGRVDQIEAAKNE